MTAYIIHDINKIGKHPEVADKRRKTLLKELSEQGIADFELIQGDFYTPNTTVNINHSHKHIVRIAKEKRLNEVLIMEDDVKFSDKGAFDYFLKNAPADFDIYLSGISSGAMGANGILVQFSGLQCYIVHSRFYDTFLAIDDNAVIDIELGVKGKCVLCQPCCTKQYAGYSYNADRDINYDHLFNKHKYFINGN